MSKKDQNRKAEQQTTTETAKEQTPVTGVAEVEKPTAQENMTEAATASAQGTTQEAAPQEVAPQVSQPQGDGSGVVVGGANTPVGNPAEPVKADALQKAVTSYAQNSRDRELGLVGFSEEFTTNAREILTSGPALSAGFLRAALNYVQEMSATAPVENEEIGARRQTVFFDSFTSFINNTTDEQEFNNVFAVFLLLVSERSAKGQAFHQTMLLRFTELMAGGQSNVSAFESLMTIFSATADISKRAKAVTYVDFSKLKNYKCLSQAGLGRLVGFYTI